MRGEVMHSYSELLLRILIIQHVRDEWLEVHSEETDSYWSAFRNHKWRNFERNIPAGDEVTFY